MICNIRLYKLNWLDLVNSKTLSLLSTNIAVNRLTSWLNVGSRHTKPSSKNCWRTTSASPPLACNSGHIVALELSTNACVRGDTSPYHRVAVVYTRHSNRDIIRLNGRQIQNKIKHHLTNIFTQTRMCLINSCKRHWCQKSFSFLSLFIFLCTEQPIN